MTTTEQQREEIEFLDTLEIITDHTADDMYLADLAVVREQQEIFFN